MDSMQRRRMMDSIQRRGVIFWCMKVCIQALVLSLIVICVFNMGYIKGSATANTLCKDVKMTLTFDTSGLYDNYTNMSVKDLQLEFDVPLDNRAVEDLLSRLIWKEV